MIDYSMVILAARTDVGYLRHTVSHLSRVCGRGSRDRVLLVDTAPVSGFYGRHRDGREEGRMEELFAECARFRDEGWIDRVVTIDYGEIDWSPIVRKYFGRDSLAHSHDRRGYPIYGSVYQLEVATHDYVVHFDCDMLIHQAPAFDWIQEGIRLIERTDDVMSVLPRSGPPTEDGEGLHQDHPYELDPREFYRFGNFTSRVFLLNRDRFRDLLPLPVRYRGGLKARARALVQGSSPLDSWERMVTEAMDGTKYCRADLATDRAWSLHPVDKGGEFVAALPEIIGNVEDGWYCEEQAGRYDMVEGYYR